jgi:hypothetical protein
MKYDIFGNPDVMDELQGEEMGFLPLLAAALPFVGSAVGGLLGGGKKKSASPPPSAVPPQIASVTDAPTKAELENIVRNLLTSVPPPVREQVSDALRDYRLADEGSKQNIDQIVAQIAGQFNPQLNAAIQALKLAKTQTGATDEHNRMMLSNKRWKQTTGNQKTLGKNQKILMKRIRDMEQRMVGMKLISGKRINLFGVR